MPPIRRTKYLLVLVDTFTGWVEAFLTTNKKASTVATLLSQEIISHFGLHASLQSDNGPEFTFSITPKLVKFLHIKWNFHIPYHLQSSGKVERINRTLKATLSKLSIKTHLYWIKLLPLALLQTQALPKKTHRISPFELLYGWPLSQSPFTSITKHSSWCHESPPSPPQEICPLEICPLPSSPASIFRRPPLLFPYRS